ncbi:MAG: hypothetical protein IJD40_07255 [Lachnospiraceae bacterium]|nr:hypothetical protein [Lachnospiraceae bacterium]
MKNDKTKGLSIVEIVILIVVLIAIIVFMFPVITGYVKKSRLQADMETAKELATVMTDVLMQEKISDNAVEHATPRLVSNMDGNDFKKAVYAALDKEEIKGKTKKNIDGEMLGVPEFYYTLSVSKKQIEIYYGGITEEYRIYPKVGSKLVK